MTDEKKTDYSKVKTHGGVMTDTDGVTHPTALSDVGRAAQVRALKNERDLLGARPNDDAVAKRRETEIVRQLAKLGERPPRGETPETASTTG